MKRLLLILLMLALIAPVTAHAGGPTFPWKVVSGGDSDSQGVIVDVTSLAGTCLAVQFIWTAGTPEEIQLFVNRGYNRFSGEILALGNEGRHLADLGYGKYVARIRVDELQLKDPNSGSLDPEKVFVPGTGKIAYEGISVWDPERETVMEFKYLIQTNCETSQLIKLRK